MPPLWAMADNRLGGGFLAPCWISARNNGFFFLLLLLPAGDCVVVLLLFLVVDFNAAFLVMSPQKRRCRRGTLARGGFWWRFDGRHGRFGSSRGTLFGHDIVGRFGSFRCGSTTTSRSGCRMVGIFVGWMDVTTIITTIINGRVRLEGTHVAEQFALVRVVPTRET